MKDIIIIVHNIRSAHNVGSLLRTADGLGTGKVYLTGYTPYPLANSDKRLPHVAQKVHKQIQKTALGAESSVDWQFKENITTVIASLKKNGYTICALEQTPASLPLHTYSTDEPVALVVGRETFGIEDEILELCDKHLHIPMFGAKESFNVTQAAAMAMYHFRFMRP